ncbi:hypothetical protein COO60DRAFT_1557241, partial [Scenedesmus sp. NREL 46B-D3]
GMAYVPRSAFYLAARPQRPLACHLQLQDQACIPILVIIIIIILPIQAIASAPSAPSWCVSDTTQHCRHLCLDCYPLRAADPLLHHLLPAAAVAAAAAAEVCLCHA